MRLRVEIYTTAYSPDEILYWLNPDSINLTSEEQARMFDFTDTVEAKLIELYGDKFLGMARNFPDSMCLGFSLKPLRPRTLLNTFKDWLSTQEV